MNADDFRRQADRLSRYFRKTPLTGDQLDEWWLAIGSHDLEDFTRAVDALITEGRVGQLPTIAQAASLTAKQKAWRLERSLPGIPVPEDFPCSPGFQADAKLNMLRLFGPVRNARGKFLPQFRGDAERGLTATDQALVNLLKLADRHQVDISRWAFVPDGNPARLRAYQVAVGHLHHPRAVKAPTASDLELLNPAWVDGVYRPGIQARLERKVA